VFVALLQNVYADSEVDNTGDISRRNREENPRLTKHKNSKIQDLKKEGDIVSEILSDDEVKSIFYRLTLEDQDFNEIIKKRHEIREKLMRETLENRKFLAKHWLVATLETYSSIDDKYPYHILYNNQGLGKEGDLTRH